MSSGQSAQHLQMQRVATPHTDREWRREHGRAYATYRKLAHAIAMATASGKRLNPVVRNFLRNPQVKMVAALKALGGETDRETIVALQSRINAWATDYLPIEWHFKRKPNGTQRPICILPPELKAVHYMVAEVIKQQFVGDATLFGVSGASRDDLARALKVLQNTGYVYLAQTDIVDCFQSIDPDALYQLPIPEEVTRQALDIRNLEAIHRDNHATSPVYRDYPSYRGHVISHEASGPKGLMQGSPASSIILAWLLNGIPSRDDARVMIFADNLVVAARTPAGSREMVNTLVAHFERCPAGPLALCEPEFADNTPLSFLGYLFAPSREHIGISDDACHRLERRLNAADVADEAQCRHILKNHQHMVRDNELFARLNPFINDFPVEIWRTLLDFRFGYPAAPSDCPELSLFLETSASAAAMRNDWRTLHLHNHLFSEPGTPEHTDIREILKRHPGQNTETPE
ncbi:reverse transcriptase (RNA-dependent DNA polymerase) [Aliiruegeria haliotis]|uniref:Reverse transcriptase (RNA-dependent DNA polymerase) n=1 Tax=Aliiruegeria haliotis TaxID=1280846 RepID=A0A2T0RDP8_9RHOB|nr:reverse transcriptase domain-containing protein [Aliiruegeria haliotis]PRY19288.1 reverse transcriptase (RNA-dependent DNA polymerase) [Aliiruegeria haliotis]